MALGSKRTAKHLLLTALSLTILVAALPAQAAPYALFESGQVRPLALSGDRQHLFATNTPDNRLEIYRVTDNGLEHQGSVTVGLEPVAVAVRDDNEIWVVNHLSDSISVVDVCDPAHPRVKQTLLVGDEPRDIVFAGPSRSRAFITTAHRGQNAPFDPELTTPGVGRADVWVFDANNLGPSSLGGAPLTVITLFTDTPRALAVSPDGARVYAAGFHTGNQTTAIHRDLVTAGGGHPAPLTDHLGAPQPFRALIVKYNGSHWVDPTGKVWDDAVRFSLPDKDVFVINATSSPPAQLAGSAGFYKGVGTIINNMIVNPASGKVYVSSTEANNQSRFEGPGEFAGTTVRGHLHESRISILGASGSVTRRHLNKHINYNDCCDPAPNAVNAKSLSLPLGMAISQSGGALYVAALGSSKIGVFSTASLENNTFAPSASSHIVLDKNGEPTGPTGLVLDEPRGRLYVLTRFDNAIAIASTSTKQVIGRVPMFNPEPPTVVAGRPFLYDARFSSSNGESSCASCHVFGDLDSLAWDLGNPDTTTVLNPGPIAKVFAFGIPTIDDFSALKGPMTTQSLRGMANHGPMHWRGDRTGGLDEPSAQPNEGSFDERAAFKQFQAGFIGLLGRSGPIPEAAMDAFAEFALQIMYPPNPIRSLDNALTPSQQAGRDHFVQQGSCTTDTCEFCHRLDPDANAELGEPFPGFFGSDGRYVLGEQTQGMKIPHFRNLYQKVGMFGMAPVPGIFSGDNQHQGDQVRGFGFVNDGAHDTLFRFMRSLGFDTANGAQDGFDVGAEGDVQRRDIEQFMLAFDSNLAPIVGQQVTVTHENVAAASARVDLLLERADAGECDAVAKVVVLNEEFGFLYIGSDAFVSSRQGLGPLHKLVLLSLAQALHQDVTFTCVPPGSGERFGIDRDEDGVLDGDE
jgi:DNA-binding beta-propeller fold protein YncE